MDKNIAALLRNDARTIRVTFGGHAEIDETGLNEVRTNNAEPKLYVVDQLKSSKGYAVSPARVRASEGYTYVTHLAVKEGDAVVVPVKSTIAIGFVVSVDDEVKIEPSDPVTYAWVISTIDLAAHELNLERNKSIASAAADAMRKNLRRGFAQSVLLSADDASRSKLELLIGAPSTDLV